jgi:HPt (histidine-containing phosphotransfer) domain-containing protein
MATPIDDAFFARLRLLGEQFTLGLPLTFARLAASHRRFDPSAPDADLVRELHQTLHTLAGSATTFGFRVLGQQARELEQRLRVLMVFEVVGAGDWGNWLDSLERYLAWAARDPRAQDYNSDMVQGAPKAAGERLV